MQTLSALLTLIQYIPAVKVFTSLQLDSNCIDVTANSSLLMTKHDHRYGVKVMSSQGKFPMAPLLATSNVIIEVEYI
ncbi:hypothetical protein J6590_054861 [Homalodisca vitripennis]|nr:hypothetical protein J6590_054861 [Homalodisca vitripennis]